MRLIKLFGVVLLAISVSSFAKFDPCKFTFGYKLDTGNFSEAEIVAQYTWQGTGLENDIANMLRSCKNNGKTPALYMYVIAKSSGLGDCDVGGGLCDAGAEYIRNNKEKIKGIYQSYATSIKNTFGTTDPIILFMEPDYYQYAQPETQWGNPLSFEEAGDFIEECIDIITSQLPNAVISLDISPWVKDVENWFNALPLDKAHFMNTSGGRSQAGSDRIKSNDGLTWARAHEVTGKCIIADCGYGVGGGGTGHDNNWDNVTNINNRINNGVVAVVQFSPKGDWDNTLSSIKGSLATPICPCNIFGPPKYSLSVTPTSGGSVNSSPEAATYDSGTTVTLTAVPSSGYKFKSWGGDTVASGSTLTLKMVKDWTVTASFVDIDAKATFILTVNTTGAGVVEVDPEKAEYDSGTIVLLTPYVVDDAEFLRWEGALSGSATPAALVMNANKTVAAFFSGSTITRENLVRNGSFDQGSEEWSFGSYEGASAEGSVESGSYNVAVATSGDESWKIQLTQGGITLTEDEDYILTFSASAQSATQIIVNVGMAAEPYDSYSRERTIDLSNVMEEHEIKFTMNKASTSEARLEFNCGKASSHLVIDNVSLMKDLELTSPVLTPDIRRSVQPVLPDEKGVVTVSLYDHAGRLLQQTSGDYRTIMSHKQVQRPGSYIAVISFAGRRIAKKMVVVR